ncbi:hypothetical protein CWI38_0053p0010 [Hamiltosporidium tvaerminnensis]|uniref:Uncharacterized protein n=1 Tax=Hamiltosporidium tvaerminnensis TaxID=1176355 RepID=A0A4Q9M4Q1_9MICR|nr:hypothetical protein CWI38_0053p0010 [Hamiltosporidium tvaerminnensis]
MSSYVEKTSAVSSLTSENSTHSCFVYKKTPYGSFKISNNIIINYFNRPPVFKSKNFKVSRTFLLICLEIQDTTIIDTLFKSITSF